MLCSNGEGPDQTVIICWQLWSFDICIVFEFPLHSTWACIQSWTDITAVAVKHLWEHLALLRRNYGYIFLHFSLFLAFLALWNNENETFHVKYVLLEEAPYADSERLDQPAHTILYIHYVSRDILYIKVSCCNAEAISGTLSM